MFKRGVGVEGGEVRLYLQFTKGHHPGLIPVITAAEVSFAEHFRKGHLGQLFAITEDAKLGFSGENFLATEQRHFTAQTAQAVIVEQLLA